MYVLRGPNKNIRVYVVLQLINYINTWIISFKRGVGMDLTLGSSF